MAFMGYDVDTMAVVEGAGPDRAYRLEPKPLLQPLAFGTELGLPDWAGARGLDIYPKFLLRENSFDPNARLKRGIVYQQLDVVPMTWRVQDPFRIDTRQAAGGDKGRYETRVAGYQAHPLGNLVGKVGTSACPKIFVGTEGFFTAWTIFAVEGAVGNGALLSLRSAGNFGILPDLAPGNIPEAIRANLIKSVDSIVAARVAIDPNSTIDRCREALTIIFGDLCDDLGKDLGKAVSAYKAKKGLVADDMLCSAASIVRKLHSRAKPSEEERLGTRSVTESDAQTAVHLVGLVLLDRHFGT